MKGLSCYFLVFLFLLPGFIFGHYNTTAGDSIENTIQKVYDHKNKFDFAHAVKELRHAVNMADTIKRKRSYYLFEENNPYTSCSHSLH